MDNNKDSSPITEAEQVRKPEISHTDTTATVVFPGLHLSANNPRTQEISVVVKKHPAQLIEGESYGQDSVLIDAESEKMKELTLKAEELKTIDENQRPRAVLELLRKNIRYAYSDVLELIKQSNPELAAWVASNTGLDSSIGNRVPLSELIDKGYGICRHLSVAYLWLAQKAGLEGTILGGPAKNIQRTDTGQKLFNSFELGQSIPGHEWVEIKTKDNKWIPVDPSTNLMGDTPEGLAMFQQANYLAQTGGKGLEVGSETNELTVSGQAPYFKPAEPLSEIGKFSLLLRSTKPTLGVHVSRPATNTPYSGKGNMWISTAKAGGDMNLRIHEVKFVSPTAQVSL